MIPENLPGIATALFFCFFKKCAVMNIENAMSHNSYEPATDKRINELSKKLSKKVGISPPKMFFHEELYGNTASVLYDKLILQKNKFSGKTALSPDEQEAIIAHEIAHIKGRDTHKTLWEGYLFSFCIGSTLGGLGSYTITETSIKALTLLGLQALSQHNIRLREFSADTESAKMTASRIPLANYFKRSIKNKDEGKRSGLDRTFNHLAQTSIENIKSVLCDDHPTPESRIRELEAIKLPRPHQP